MKIKHRIIGKYATKRCFYLFLCQYAAGCRVCFIPRKYGRFMLLIDNNLLLSGANYIYWIISTENDHRHHHKFIKYEKRLRKEGNMPRLTYQAKSLPLQSDFGRVALPSVRSNGPTDPLQIYILHLFHLEDTALLFIFLSESVKVRFLQRVDTVSLAQ